MTKYICIVTKDTNMKLLFYSVIITAIILVNIIVFNLIGSFISMNMTILNIIGVLLLPILFSLDYIFVKKILKKKNN